MHANNVNKLQPTMKLKPDLGDTHSHFTAKTQGQSQHRQHD